MKVSEKKLMYSIISLITGIVFLLNVSLVNSPVRLSEKGMAVLLPAIVFIIFSIHFLKNSILKK